MTNTNFEAFQNSLEEYLAQNRHLSKVNWREKMIMMIIYTEICHFGRFFRVCCLFCHKYICLNIPLWQWRFTLRALSVAFVLLLLPRLLNRTPTPPWNAGLPLLFSRLFKPQALSWTLKKEREKKEKEKEKKTQKDCTISFLFFL